MADATLICPAGYTAASAEMCLHQTPGECAPRITGHVVNTVRSCATPLGTSRRGTLYMIILVVVLFLALCCSPHPLPLVDHIINTSYDLAPAGLPTPNAAAAAAAAAAGFWLGFHDAQILHRATHLPTAAADCQRPTQGRFFRGSAAAAAAAAAAASSRRGFGWVFTMSK